MIKRKLRKASQLFLITALILSTFNGSFFGVRAEEDAELLPGEVTTKTTVVPSSDLNVWDVTVRIEGRKPEGNLDVVLVVDTSGSMNESGGAPNGTDKKMATTKKTASDFVDTLLSSAPTTKIALVSFASNAIKHTDFISDASLLKSKIDALEPLGEGFTQDSLKLAKELVRTSSATDKVVILISDGSATSSYNLNDKSSYFNSTDSESGKIYTVNDDNVPESAFNYDATPVGVGGAVRFTLDYITTDGEHFVYSHNNSAVAESRFIKEAGAEIYAFGMMQMPNPQAEKMFKNIANPGNYHWAKNDLSDAFDDLLSKLVSPARDLSISVPMEKGFILNGLSKNIEVSQGEVKYQNRAITWTVDNLTNAVSTGSDVFFAEMKYQIKVDGQIIEVPVPEDELYVITKPSELTYNDSSSTDRTKDIVFDKVDPLLVTLETQLFDALGNKVSGINPFFDVSITENSNTPEEYNMAANAKMFVPDQARGSKYLVSVDGTKYPDYATEYYVNDEKNSDYSVPTTGNRDIKIIVKNTEKALGSITVENIAKEVDGSLSTGGSFKYEISGPKKTDDTSVLEGITGITNENGKYFITVTSNSKLNIEGLPYGEYGLTAIVNDEYSATVTPSTVTLSITEKTKEFVAVHEKIDKPYTVVFNSNGGEGNMDGQAFSLNEEKNLASNEFTREGFAFDSWNTSASGDAIIFNDGQKVKNITVDDEITLYAQWDANPYSVQFNPNNGEGTMENQAFVYEIEQNLSANEFTRGGYTFVGWNSEEDGTGTEYADKEGVKNLTSERGGIVQVYAQWEANEYTVSFHPEMGDLTPPTSQLFTYDVEQALDLNPFTKIGYTFRHWYSIPTGKSIFNSSIGKTYQDGEVVKNLTTGTQVVLISEWTANPYTVQFIANDGAGTMDAQDFTYDEMKALDLNEFVREGYTFAGWNTQADGSGESLNDAEQVLNLTSEAEGVVQIFAQWTKIPVTPVEPENPTVKPVEPDKEAPKLPATGISENNTQYFAVGMGFLLILINAKERKNKNLLKK